MKSWKGQELGYTAMGPGDPGTMLSSKGAGAVEVGEMGMPNKSPGHNTKAYNLPVTDVQKERRNFKGVDSARPYSLEELIGETPNITRYGEV